MTSDSNKIIFAPATHPGRSGISVIRISGKGCKTILEKISNIKAKDVKPRKVFFCDLINPFTKLLIDKIILIFFEAPHSFTGEDVIELHLHGSIFIINHTMDVLAKFDNFRVALPGEFSKRSFLNGKMDLTQAEGLVDLIDSETELQHKQAIRQLEGNLEKLYEDWRKKIIRILARLEAYIDFPEEEIPTDITHNINQEIIFLSKEIENHLNNKNGEKIRNGIKVAIIGKPNAGKSTLINYLCNREVAIVSNIEGTTRDAIEVHLNIGGYPITLVDTAGIRESTNEIEIEGIKRAIKQAENSDLNILLFAADDNQLDEHTLKLVNNNSINLINKIDLKENSIYEKYLPNYIKISLKNCEGLDELFKIIENKAQSIASPSLNPVITRTRYRNHLNNCLQLLENFTLENEIELACEDLRIAAREIGQITGIIDVEILLDEIFATFCIGK